MNYDNFNKLEKTTGNRYAAVQEVIKQARVKYRETNYKILPSEAISWALDGTVPESVKKGYVNKKPYSVVDEAFDSYLFDIDDEDVRESVKTSINLSYSRGHLVYRYEMTLDKFRQARVRVITNMLWDKIQKDRRKY